MIKRLFKQKKLFLLFLTFIFIVFTADIHAEENIKDNNKYVTIVNPVRGRNLWDNKGISSLEIQYEAVKNLNLSATWLLQYDALKDNEIPDIVKQFDQNQEKGVFLEVSKELAEDARVLYPHGVRWSNPKAVFLSGYAQDERKKIIDTLFKKHRETFGFYPQSVGAWWIDSYSLNYMKNKYHIKAAMIVADQQTTDDYGVWGQWWGVPYLPSEINILVPSQDSRKKQEIVVIQWAQRDLSLAYGEGPRYSNYSLQANDYLERGRNTEYFKELTSTYLDCNAPVCQITVGLEVGMEGFNYIEEYKKQLEYLSNVEGLESVTMGEFAAEFFTFNSGNPLKLILEDNKTAWTLSGKERKNDNLGEKQNYNPQISFSDYFVADKEDFLNRRLSSLDNLNTTKPWVPLYLLVILLFGFYAFKEKLIFLWLSGVALAFGAFGLLLRSKIQFGWKVFYGPVFENINLSQVFVVCLSFLSIWIFYKITKNKGATWFLPLTFGITFLIKMFRYTLFEGKYYFGLMLDALRFVGFSFSKAFRPEIVIRDFPSEYASALLKLGDSHIWERGIVAIIIYVMINYLGAVVIWKLSTLLPKKFKNILTYVLIAFFLCHLISIFMADPIFVLPA